MTTTEKPLFDRKLTESCHACKTHCLGGPDWRTLGYDRQGPPQPPPKDVPQPISDCYVLQGKNRPPSPSRPVS